MNKDEKSRNVVVSIILWLAVLVNLALTVGFAISMDQANLMDETLGLGLCAMFTFADVLGSILLLRWSKNGLGLIAMSAILLSIVYAFILHTGLVSLIPIVGSVVLLWIILQLRKGGKSAWSQLKSGWDSKHCRHIYQIFAFVEFVLFVLTLIAFSGRQGRQDNSDPISILQVDSIESNEKLSPKKKVEVDSVPSIESVKSEHPMPQQKKENGTKENNSQKSYSLEDAVNYLDSHAVWKVSEMNQYPDLQNLRECLKGSLNRGRDMVPSSLSRKSKMLGEFGRLLRELEHLSSSGDYGRIRSRLKAISYRVSSDEIYIRMINLELRELVENTRASEKRKKSSGDDEQQNSNQSSESNAKKRSIGGSSPSENNASPTKSKNNTTPKKSKIRIKDKEQIDKEIERYKKMVSDSIKNANPTFGLG